MVNKMFYEFKSVISSLHQASIGYDSDLCAAYGLSSETCMLFTMLGRLGFASMIKALIKPILDQLLNSVFVRICLSGTLLSQISAISKMF
jgi:hypothetical protein